MGQFFNTKSPGGTIINRKRVSGTLGRQDISKMSKGLGFTQTGATNKFTDIMMKAKSGGWTREEVHAGLQEMILSGKATKEQARNIAKRIGLELDRFQKFKNRSESRESDRKNPEESRKESMQESNVDKKEADKAEATGQKNPAAPGNASSTMKLKSNFVQAGQAEEIAGHEETHKKPESIWTLLNKPKS